MVAVGVLAAATEYACGLLVLAAFFPWRIRGKLRSAAAPFICGLVHILFSVLTTAWPLLPRVILILANFYLVSSACFQGNWGKKIFNHTFLLGICLRTRSFCPDAVRGNEQSTGPDSTFSGGQLLILRFVQSISAARRFSRLQVPCSASKAKGKGRLWTVYF